ncbi:hypothetical protein [Peribacillus loiseleuriae]|uniref:hypothetical protein n=1 Tax=Peribacillus loiseleuriae TaxID=1679170 RepID=UPI003CFE9640
MKKVLVFLCLIMFSSSSVALAETKVQDQVTKSCSLVFDKETKKNIDTYQDKEASLQESYTIDFIKGILDFAGINSLGNLIFGNPYCVWNNDKSGELVSGIFTNDEKTKIIDPLIKLLNGSFLLILLLSILLNQMKRMKDSVLGRNRTTFWEEVSQWLIAVFFMFTYWYIVEIVFDMNTVIVHTIRDLLDSQGIEYSSISLLSSKNEFSFTDIIVFLAEWFLAMYLNLFYIFRKIIILLMIMLGPVAGYSLLFASTNKFFSTWIKEFVGLTLTHSIHAVFFYTFILSSQIVSGEMSVMTKMGFLLFFIPLNGIVLNWLNLSESPKLTSSLGLTGMATLAAATRGLKQDSGPTLGKPTDLGSNSKTKISELATGDNSKGWNSTKRLIGGFGGIVGGVSGSVLGAKGAAVGAMAGSGFSKGILQGSRNLTASAKGVYDSVKDVKNREGTVRNALQDIQERRNFFGNIGESMGSIVGAGPTGRAIGHTISGVSRQRLMNSNELGGMNGLDLKKLSALHPGADVKWMQNNEGSAFYLNENDKLSRISPIGAADTNLLDGENRMVDFKLNGGYNLQSASNGIYQNASLNQTSGINTSTPFMNRQTEAYMYGGGGGILKDSRFEASSINPDSYYGAGLNNVDTRTTGDRLADTLGNVYSNGSRHRHKGFV